MKVTFYSGFSKRFNSTKRPTGGVVKEVTLKDRTSIKNPTFKVIDDGKDYTYCKYDKYYYYINNKIYYPNNVIDYVCGLDVLATNKTFIGNSKFLIDRCSCTTDDNKYFTDPYNTPTEQKLIKTTEIMNLVGYFDALSPYYLVTVMGNGGLYTFSLTGTKMTELMEFIAGVNDPLTGETSTDILKFIYSVKRSPYKISGDETSSNYKRIILGNHLSPVWANCITAGTSGNYKTDLSGSVTLNFPSGEYWGGSNYTDFSPYSTGLLYLPYVGIVELDLDVYADTRKISVTYTLDCYTGDIIYKCEDGNGHLINSYSGNCTSNVAISASSNDKAGMVQGTIQTIGGIALISTAIGSIATSASTALAPFTGGASLAVGATVDLATLALGASQIAKGIDKNVKSSVIHCSSNGTISSNLGGVLGLKVTAIIITKKPSNTDLYANVDILGMPYNKYGSVADLTNGNFIKTINASVQGYLNTGVATSQLLDSGIYYE